MQKERGKLTSCYSVEAKLKILPLRVSPELFINQSPVENISRFPSNSTKGTDMRTLWLTFASVVALASEVFSLFFKNSVRRFFFFTAAERSLTAFLWPHSRGIPAQSPMVYLLCFYECGASWDISWFIPSTVVAGCCCVCSFCAAEKFKSKTCVEGVYLTMMELEGNDYRSGSQSGKSRRAKLRRLAGEIWSWLSDNDTNIR